MSIILGKVGNKLASNVRENLQILQASFLTFDNKYPLTSKRVDLEGSSKLFAESLKI